MGSIKRKTALVLSGGGSFGAVQVGMLKALVAHGLAVDLVVGSSVGAINGGYFAGAPTIDGIARLEQLWRGINRKHVFPVGWRSLFGLVRGRDFLVPSNRLHDLVAEHLPFRRLEDSVIPFYVVATDVMTGAAVVLSHGNAADAIVASAAIPAAFAPVEIEGRYLVDGAITSNTPIKIAVSLGATRLIVLPTGFACNIAAPPQGAIAHAVHALTLLVARQTVQEIEGLGRDIDYTVVPALCPYDGSAYDFSAVSGMIDLAENNTRAWIVAGGLERRVIPDGLRPHNHRHPSCA